MPESFAHLLSRGVGARGLGGCCAIVGSVYLGAGLCPTPTNDRARITTTPDASANAQGGQISTGGGGVSIQPVPIDVVGVVGATQFRTTVSS